MLLFSRARGLHYRGAAAGVPAAVLSRRGHQARHRALQGLDPDECETLFTLLHFV